MLFSNDFNRFQHIFEIERGQPENPRTKWASLIYYVGKSSKSMGHGFLDQMGLDWARSFFLLS